MDLNLPSVIEGLLDNGIGVALEKDEDGQIAFIVEGFGKNGRMKFYRSTSKEDEWAELYGIDRYGEKDHFQNLEDVVRCYMNCAEAMSERCGGTAQDGLNGLHGEWADLAVKLELLEAKTVTTVTYRRR